jgi:hypothetical protein
MIIRREGATFDEKQEKVLKDIEFFSVGYTLTATRGHSSPLEQLRIIEYYAKQDGVLLKPFVRDDLYSKAVVAGNEVFLWQPTWSALLHLFHMSKGRKGKKINPPLAAECLDDYVGSAGVNMKGKIIYPSPHIAGGKSGMWPIDFSGRVTPTGGVELNSLDIVADVIHEAQLSGVPIKNITIEQGNNCVHVDLKEIA